MDLSNDARTDARLHSLDVEMNQTLPPTSLVGGLRRNFLWFSGRALLEQERPDNFGLISNCHKNPRHENEKLLSSWFLVCVV